jgi:hypothetical protein
MHYVEIFSEGVVNIELKQKLEFVISNIAKTISLTFNKKNCPKVRAPTPPFTVKRSKVDFERILHEDKRIELTTILKKTFKKM